MKDACALCAAAAAARGLCVQRADAASIAATAAVVRAAIESFEAVVALIVIVIPPVTTAVTAVALGNGAQPVVGEEGGVEVAARVEDGLKARQARAVLELLVEEGVFYVVVVMAVDGAAAAGLALAARAVHAAVPAPAA